MVAGKIVEYPPDNNTDSIPAEHTSLLTQAARPDNMAVFARMTPVLSAVSVTAASYTTTNTRTSWNFGQSVGGDAEVLATEHDL